MDSGLVSRRRFLGASTVGGAALAMGLKVGPAFGQSSDAVRFGIIGTGGRARWLLDLIKGRKDMHIAALCDINPDAIGPAMELIEGHKPKTYTDFRKMLDEQKLDGVWVTTRPGQHAEVAIPVLEAGFNVFCEKPLETTVEKVDRLTQAARKAKGVCQIGLQRRYKPGYIEAVRKIQEGAVGAIRFIEGHWKWVWPVGGWLADIEASGGELVEQAVHHMDIIAWIMKQQHPLRAVSMAGIMRDNPDKSVVEDHSSTIFEFPGGVKFQYTHLFYVSTPKFCGELLRVYGQTGGAELYREDYFARMHWKAYDAQGKESVFSEGSCDHGEASVKQLVDFGRCCRTGEKPACDIEVARLATLMGIMGRMAMFDPSANNFEPRVIEWKDLKSTTEPA